MKTTWTFVLMLWAAANLSAQDFFEAYKADANKYLLNYSRPLFEAMLFNSSDGWVHRAKALKPFRFALDVNTDYAFVPERYQTFTFDPAAYQTLSLVDENGQSISGSVQMPTVFGPDTDYKIHIKAEGQGGTYNEANFQAPPGFGDEFSRTLSFLPVGMPGVSLQLRAGLPLNTEIMVRYFPETEYQGFKANVLGLGVKHDIGQYLKLKKMLRLSAFAVYSGSSMSYASDTINFSGHFSMNILTFGPVVSMEYKVASLYAGAAYVRAWNRFQILGTQTYTYDVTDGSGHVVAQLSETVKDPVDLRFTVNEYRAFAGVQFNLWILRIFVQYNLQKYPGLHAGLSIKV